MRKLLLVLPLLLPLAGCATVGGHLARLFHFERAPALDVHPALAKLPPVETPAPGDRLYRQARTLIEQRDYAGALDLLQLARGQAPQDARILNAMGVVYDKIGRLDLSERYYELALTNDPGSPVVLANMRYSTEIGRQLAVVRTGATIPLAAAAPAPQAARPPAAPASVLAAAAGPQRNAAGALVLQAAAPVQLAALHAGKPLTIIDATGGGQGEASVRAYLASAGWSLAPAAVNSGARSPSSVRYPQEHRALAEALARTLPFRVALTDCAGRCTGLELVLGRDAPQRLSPYSKEHVS